MKSGREKGGRCKTKGRKGKAKGKRRKKRENQK
jgi:hypothetical protein